MPSLNTWAAAATGDPDAQGDVEAWAKDEAEGAGEGLLNGDGGDGGDYGAAAGGAVGGDANTAAANEAWDAKRGLLLEKLAKWVVALRKLPSEPAFQKAQAAIAIRDHLASSQFRTAFGDPLNPSTPQLAPWTTLRQGQAGSYRYFRKLLWTELAKLSLSKYSGSGSAASSYGLTDKQYTEAVNAYRIMSYLRQTNDWQLTQQGWVGDYDLGPGPIRFLWNVVAWWYGDLNRWERLESLGYPTADWKVELAGKILHCASETPQSTFDAAETHYQRTNPNPDPGGLLGYFWKVYDGQAMTLTARDGFWAVQDAVDKGDMTGGTVYVPHDDSPEIDPEGKPVVAPDDDGSGLVVVLAIAAVAALAAKGL
jgi:hypothetical protein